jgi:V8-like Glu-specific endopeptidase
MTEPTYPVAAGDDPLTTAQLAMFENVAATESMPAQVATRLATRRIQLSGTRGDIDLQRSRDEYGPRAYELTLDGDTTIGIPGRTAVRRPISDVPDRDGAELAAHRPNWVPHRYQPKLSSVPHWARGPVLGPGRRSEVYYGVFPPEDRKVYYPTGYPWQCVGRIFAWNDASAAWPAWSGSAVLVGPRLVLTAGHVVPWDASTWMMRFVPAYYDGQSALGAGAESYVSDAHGWDVSYYSQTPDAHDMAVLRLYDPLGESLGFFGSKPYSDSWNGQPYWNITGYPGAIASAERPSYQLDISVIEAEPSTDALDIEHRGDSTRGDSGAPFWATWPDGFPYVIGTVSGGEIVWDANGAVTEDNNNVAGGNAVNDLIRWGRQTWP